MLCLDNTQVEIFNYSCLLVSYFKISFEVRDQAGVVDIMGIGAEKVISWCADNHDLTITLESVQGRFNRTRNKAKRFEKPLDEYVPLATNRLVSLKSLDE